MPKPSTFELAAFVEMTDHAARRRYDQAIRLLMQACPELSRSAAARRLHALLEIDDISELVMLPHCAIAAWKTYHGQP